MKRWHPDTCSRLQENTKYLPIPLEVAHDTNQVYFIMITLKQKNHYMKHQVAILDAIIKKYEPSDLCVHIPTDHELFEDSCKFIGLRYEIFELKKTLENMIRYNEYIIKSTGEE